MTSTPQPTHTSLPTLTSARSHSGSSQLSTLTTCDIPTLFNRISTSVSPLSSPFPVSPAPLGSFHANTDQTRIPQPESQQLQEFLPPYLPYHCSQVVDTGDDSSDPDPVGRIWRQECNLTQKGRAALPSRVCKLSSLPPFKRARTTTAQTEALPENLVDVCPFVFRSTKQLWVPSFPGAKTPNHRLADPGRSQLRRHDFLGSTDPIITPQVIAAETASVNSSFLDVDGRSTTTPKVKFWIPGIHSSPFSAARSFVTVSPADVYSEAAPNLSQNIDIAITLGRLGETPGHQQGVVFDRACSVTEYRVRRDPGPSGVLQVS
jgi:hypothetical protein